VVVLRTAERTAAMNLVDAEICNGRRRDCRDASDTAAPGFFKAAKC
jgi:hypothetical protein